MSLPRKLDVSWRPKANLDHSLQGPTRAAPSTPSLISLHSTLAHSALDTFASRLFLYHVTLTPTSEPLYWLFPLLITLTLQTLTYHPPTSFRPLLKCHLLQEGLPIYPQGPPLLHVPCVTIWNYHIPLLAISSSPTSLRTARGRDWVYLQSQPKDPQSM